MQCPKCQEQNLADAKFCANCGRPLSGDIPSYLLEEEPDLWDKVKELKEGIEKKITRKNYKEVLADKANPVTNMLIVFLAWLLMAFIGTRPLIIILYIISFLMGPVGLIFLLAATYVYSTHYDEIRKTMKKLKVLEAVGTLKHMIKAVGTVMSQQTNEDEDEEEKENEVE